MGDKTRHCNFLHLVMDQSILDLLTIYKGLKMPGWKIESLRLTQFVTSVQQPKELEAKLEQATGGKQPTVQKSSLHFRGYTEIEDRLLHLAWQPQRMDVVLGCAVIDPSVAIGSEEEINSLAKKWLPPWLWENLEVVRLALGITLFVPVSDFTAANKFLQPLLGKHLKITDNTRDLIYRVNRPSKLPSGYDTNCLATWSVGMRQAVSVLIPPFEIRTPQVKGEPILTARLEIDANTQPKSDFVIPNEKRVETFEGLLAQALEIVKHGDIGE